MYSNQIVSNDNKKLPNLRQRLKQNSRLLPQHAVEIMTQWYDRNYSNPYPTFRDCEILASNGGITIEQVKQWFVNVRRRTQNQFRKQRTSYNLKRKSDEFQSELDTVVKEPQQTKQKIELQEMSHSSYPQLISTPDSTKQNYFQNYNYNAYYNYYYNYNQANDQFNNQSSVQYFDKSGYLKPSKNCSYDSNISFDFSNISSPTNSSTTSPSFQNSSTYSYFNYNYAFNSPVSSAKPINNQYYNY